jgi:predicted ferric reductase
MMLKIILLLNLLLQTIAVPCYTPMDVFNKGLTSYKGKVYDITNYVHPGGQKSLSRCKGLPLEEFFDKGKYNFHITSSKVETFNDLNGIYVGQLCVNPTPTPNYPSNSSSNSTDNNTYPYPTPEIPEIPENEENEESIDPNILFTSITLSFFPLFLFSLYVFRYVKCFRENLYLGCFGYVSKDLIFFYIIYTVWWILLLTLSFLNEDELLSRLGIWISLNIAFTLLPVTRNSLWNNTSLKISYYKLISFHKYIAVLTLLSVLVKSIVIFFMYGYNLFYENSSTISATISSLSILLTTILSTQPIRKYIFELFYYSHKILSIVTIVSMSLHYIVCLYYVIPSMILYVVDIILRRINTHKAIYAKIKNFELSDKSTSYIFITISVVKPIKIEAGCYFFIKCDNISKLQSHPLSLVYESYGNLVFCVKNMGKNSWSNNLIELENNDNLYTVTDLSLQGPYSHVKLNYNYSYILNIANGIGITPFISILQEIKQKNIKSLLIWIIPDISFFIPFKDIFEKMISVKVNVYLTKESKNIGKEDFYNLSFINEKPNVEKLIENFIKENEITNIKDMSVISCGSPSLINDIFKSSTKYKFDLYNETFN